MHTSFKIVIEIRNPAGLTLDVVVLQITMSLTEVMTSETAQVYHVVSENVCWNYKMALYDLQPHIVSCINQ